MTVVQTAFLMIGLHRKRRIKLILDAGSGK
jgi:hypothetical protein